MDQAEMMKQILAIQRDPTLTEAEKAAKRQALMAGKWANTASNNDEESTGTQEGGGEKEEMV